MSRRTDELHLTHPSQGFLHFERGACISDGKRGCCESGMCQRMLGAGGSRTTIDRLLGGDRVLADLRGAQHAVEQQVEVMRHLLGTLTRPDVQRLGRTLRLLK